jgi:hypothetical protein
MRPCSVGGHICTASRLMNKIQSQLTADESIETIMLWQKVLVLFCVYWPIHCSLWSPHSGCSRMGSELGLSMNRTEGKHHAERCSKKRWGLTSSAGAPEQSPGLRKRQEGPPSVAPDGALETELATKLNTITWRSGWSTPSLNNPSTPRAPSTTLAQTPYTP